MSLSVSLLCAAPMSSWTQTVSSIQQPSPNQSNLFSSFDDPLIGAAGTLLASTTETSSVAAATPGTGELHRATPLNAVILAQPGPRYLLSPPSSRAFPSESPNASLSLATARLDLLRPMIEPILQNRGVPLEMAAVVAVESGGRSSALSAKGARGLWQLMPDTARRYGLRVDETRDDRIDLFKATDAAARYLHDLYAQFGDWKLALAAYNTGEANVDSAMLRAHTGDFDRLTNLRMLPLETRNYVPRVLAEAKFMGLGVSVEVTPAPVTTLTVFAVSSR